MKDVDLLNKYGKVVGAIRYKKLQIVVVARKMRKGEWQEVVLANISYEHEQPLKAAVRIALAMGYTPAKAALCIGCGTRPVYGDNKYCTPRCSVRHRLLQRKSRHGKTSQIPQQELQAV